MSSRRRVVIVSLATSGTLAICAAAGAVVITRHPHSAAAGGSTAAGDTVASSPRPTATASSGSTSAHTSGNDVAAGSPSRAGGQVTSPRASGSPAGSPSGGASPAGGTATSAPAAFPSVPKLRGLTPPDIVVDLHHGATTAQLARLRRRPGIEHVAALSRGRVALGGHRLQVAGVPLATIRGFTPKLTAVSNRLWRSVAEGELTVAYTSDRPLRHRLGDTFPATGAHQSQTQLRIGAFATIALPQVQGLVSSQRAATLRLPANRELLISAPKVPLDQLRGAVTDMFGSSTAVHVTRPLPVDQSIASPYALTAIPPTYLALYRRAAPTCPGLPWTVLAGIGTVETGNGSNVHRSTAGAEGPMQFEPSTWARYGIDADGDGVANINDPVDAVFSAARYLCAAGAGRGSAGIAQSVFSYNHAWWYVREVLDLANRYA